MVQPSPKAPDGEAPMKIRFSYSLMTAGLLLAACGGQGPGSRDNGSGGAPAAANQATATQPNAAAQPAPVAPEAAPTVTLAGTGLGPGLAFGMRQAPAVAAAVKAFGAPT